MIKLKNFLIFLKNNLLKKKKIIIPYNYKLYQILKNLKQELNIAEFYYIANFIIIIFNHCIKSLKIFLKPNFKFKINKNIYKFSFIKKELYLISTTKGLMSALKAYKLNLKGPLVCVIYFK